MKFLSRVFLLISHLLLWVAMPVCCVVEYYAWLKMGMYRYLVLKNTWWLKNIFTVETVPYIRIGAVIVMVAVLFRCRLSLKSYRFAYGVLLAVGSSFLFRSDYFFSLRAAPWFGLSLILSEIFFILSLLTNEG
ncbi:MAG: hypothetical protein IJP53_06000 [Synergistaceae bacterium]|nr:hypothetical protein [Synergistaceae bacterium]